YKHAPFFYAHLEAPMIHFNCEQCGKSYNVNDTMAGRTAPCQQCGHELTVPPPSPWETVPVPPTAPKQVFCTNCGSPVSAQAIVCMSCGAKPVGHKKFCRHCGVGLNPEQIVCIKCGAASGTSETEQLIQDGMNRLGQGVRHLTSGIRNGAMTIGDVIILASAVLAFLSFFLPWIQPPVFFSMRVLSRNGFYTHAFWFGIVFIFPVWMVLAKKRAFSCQVGEYVCAGIGLILGMIHKRVLIGLIYSAFLREQLLRFPVDSLDEYIRKQMAQEAAQKWLQLQQVSAGIGTYLFIFACIVLIIGIALINRPFNRT
ncbi:MAG: zinc ribbon domain-containing protein, partial [Planctomycetaceae bacterium]|nr:zinc ribbon domain-containing protein [Planctomycetaceae bacterium]